MSFFSKEKIFQFEYVAKNVLWMKKKKTLYTIDVVI